MIALDLVGCFFDEPDSQSYPLAWIGWIYPNRGDFLAVAGDLGTGEQLARVRRGMAAGTTLPVVSVRAPWSSEWVTLSDHRSFRELGMSGVLLTDTAMLRNRHYHGRGDLPGTLDYARMARVVEGLQGLLVAERAVGEPAR